MSRGSCYGGQDTNKMGRWVDGLIMGGKWERVQGYGLLSNTSRQSCSSPMLRILGDNGMEP